jgi:glutathione S-transferase
MKLFWSSRSPFVRKVMVVAHEAGLNDRIERLPVVVSMTSEPTVEVMRHNPLNKIPTLITDDGLVLFESVVICEYLDSLHSGTRMFPVDTGRRWQALRWQALGSGMLEAELLWRSETRRPQASQMAVVIHAFEKKIGAALDVLEIEADELKSAPFGIGHVSIACALAYLDFRFIGYDWRIGRPGIAGVYEALNARPSMQATAFVDA